MLEPQQDRSRTGAANLTSPCHFRVPTLTYIWGTESPESRLLQI